MCLLSNNGREKPSLNKHDQNAFQNKNQDHIVWIYFFKISIPAHKSVICKIFFLNIPLIDVCTDCIL